MCSSILAMKFFYQMKMNGYEVLLWNENKYENSFICEYVILFEILNQIRYVPSRFLLKAVLVFQVASLQCKFNIVR